MTHSSATDHHPDTGSYPRLLSPFRIRGAQFRNRAIMGSMHTGLEDDIADVDKLAAYFAERAKGGAAAVVTGGYSPTQEGVLSPYSTPFNSQEIADAHRRITEAVHHHDSLAFLQLLHAGRYAFHPMAVSASDTHAPISPFPARELTSDEVTTTVDAFAHSAALAAQAGYDGVQIMGSEGYLINQFLSKRTNDREDEWGERPRFALEVAKAIRAAVPDDFVVDFRLSMVELVEDGQTHSEILDLASSLEAAGVDMLTTGIGWHEAKIPTVITSVPRAAFNWATAAVKNHVSIPVVASNRINTPQVAEDVLAGRWDDTGTEVDFVSMARPWLADPQFINRAAAGHAEYINHCIACNQACLDHVFSNKRATCLVNPQAGFETELQLHPISHSASKTRPTKVAVLGAGVAGLFGAEALAQRGFSVEVFEAQDHIGGQFTMAMTIPGKEEFRQTLTSVSNRLAQLNVPIHTSSPRTVTDLFAEGFDEIIVATGVKPHIPDIPGLDDALNGNLPVTAITYAQLLDDKAPTGDKIAIIGAGGIGFDIAEYLVGGIGESTVRDSSIAPWEQHWGISRTTDAPGNLTDAHPHRAAQEITMIQRKPTPQGVGLNRTTGWVHRLDVAAAGVTQISGAAYSQIDANGLHLNVPVNDAAATSKAIRQARNAGDEERVAELEADLRTNRREITLDVDTIVLCTGQRSVVDEDIEQMSDEQRRHVHIVGGADVAAELDAKRAIKQAIEVAAAL